MLTTVNSVLQSLQVAKFEESVYCANYVNRIFVFICYIALPVFAWAFVGMGSKRVPYLTLSFSKL